MIAVSVIYLYLTGEESFCAVFSYSLPVTYIFELFVSLTSSSRTAPCTDDDFLLR